MPNMLWAIVGDIIVVANGQQIPTDAEWDAYLKFVGEHLASAPPRAVVFSEGGGPTPAQRRRLYDLTSNSAGRVAVLTNSVMGRGITNAVQIASPYTYRMFARVEMADALAFLEEPAEAGERIEQEGDRLLAALKQP